MVVSSEWQQISTTKYIQQSSFHKTTKEAMDSESQDDSVMIDNEISPDGRYSMDDEERSPHNSLIHQDSDNQDSLVSIASPGYSRQDFPETFSNAMSQNFRDSISTTESQIDRSSVNMWNMYDDFDDMSVASGHSFSTYDTNATSESVQDIITRLQSETDRRRRRLLRHRQMRSFENRKSSDRLQKYNSRSSVYADPKLGITVEIKENP